MYDDLTPSELEETVDVIDPEQCEHDDVRVEEDKNCWEWIVCEHCNKAVQA